MAALLVLLGGGATMLLLLLAANGPSGGRAGNRRLAAVKERHGDAAVVADAQLRRITAQRETRMDAAVGRVLPNREQLAKRLAMTGKNWTVGQYGMAGVGLFLATALLVKVQGAPWLLTLFAGVIGGLGLPHFFIGRVIARRLGKFNAKFPDAIELLVRGLRAGLPISETMGVVAHEVPGPVGEEFRSVTDKMKIGRTMDAALQETAERLGTPEFQFFVITIAIQRETGGNLAETLANLADVLRKRGQMKLKIRAMSSESKASAYIVGSLPFIVFGLIYFISPHYMGRFFIDERLIAIGLGGMVWMGLGAAMMAKMVNFEI